MLEGKDEWTEGTKAVGREERHTGAPELNPYLVWIR